MTSISGSFLNYVEPVLEQMGSPEPGSVEFESLLRLGWIIWNAVVKNDSDGDISFLNQIKTTVPASQSGLIDFLIDRKRKEFSEHKFFLGNYELRKKPDGSLSLYVVALESAAARVQ